MSLALYFHFSIDGISGALVLFGEEDTEFSTGYTDTRFKNVTLGVEAEEVQELLGEPLQKTNREAFEIWSYSRPRGESHYRVREIILSEESHRVVDKSAYFQLRE